MKSTHKILIAILLVLLSFSLVFTSCGETGDETTAEDKTPEITTEETAPVDSPDETTESPVQTTETPDETTAEVTEEKTETKASETTAEPQMPETTAEVTTAPPAETTAEVTTAPPAETTAPIPEETTQVPHEHVWSAWTTVLSAACTTEGKQERTCSCGEKETKALAAVGHSEVIDKAVAATCAQNGLTEGKHCKVCKEIILAQKTTPMSEHTYVNYICKVCKATTYPSSAQLKEELTNVMDSSVSSDSETPEFVVETENRNGFEIISSEKTDTGMTSKVRIYAPDLYTVVKELDSKYTFNSEEDIQKALAEAIKNAKIVEKEITLEFEKTAEGYVPVITEEFLDAYYGGVVRLFEEMLAKSKG